MVWIASQPRVDSGLAESKGLEPDRIYVVYDGECPFCRNYVRLANMRAAGTQVELVDAREKGPAAMACARRGLDLDAGMVVIMDGQFYHGSDAVNRIALLSSSSGPFNRLNRRIFRHPGLARFLYPALRACRNLTIRLLGVKPIGLRTRHRGVDASD